MKTFKEKIQALAGEYSDEIIHIRRYFHQHPELSKEEYGTMEKICSHLDRWGIPYEKGIAGTGVVAMIEGEAGNGKTIALRADMDALPVTETSALPFISLNKGIMHACGHDMHTASLLGTAKILQTLKSRLKGKVKLIFQPSEEVLPGGAKPMIEAGVLQAPEVDMIIGQHVCPDLNVGEVGIKKGVYMASSDEIYIRVTGKGGHAALPAKFINPLIIASNILLALQEMSRGFTREDSPLILTFGRITGNGQMNLVPDQVDMSGILRTFDEEKRASAKKEIIKICKNISREAGGDCEVRFVESYPSLINDEHLSKQFRKYAGEYAGESKVKSLTLRTTTDDFAYFSRQIPSLFYRIGVGKHAGNLHSSNFNPDENSLIISMGLMAYLVMNFL